jgi:subtilase family serine protease
MWSTIGLRTPSRSAMAPRSAQTTWNIKTWNELCELAAWSGISVQASSGDYGDRVADEGAVDVNVPADSLYATGVGGVSIAYVLGTALTQTGWGHNLTHIGTSGVSLDPPVSVPQTRFGSGGG